MISSGVNLLNKLQTSTQRPQTTRMPEDYRPIVTKEENITETTSYTNQTNQIDPSYFPTLQ